MRIKTHKFKKLKEILHNSFNGIHIHEIPLKSNNLTNFLEFRFPSLYNSIYNDDNIFNQETDCQYCYDEKYFNYSHKEKE